MVEHFPHLWGKRVTPFHHHQARHAAATLMPTMVPTRQTRQQRAWSLKYVARLQKAPHVARLQVRARWRLVLGLQQPTSRARLAATATRVGMALRVPSKQQPDLNAVCEETRRILHLEKPACALSRVDVAHL